MANTEIFLSICHRVDGRVDMGAIIRHSVISWLLALRRFSGAVTDNIFDKNEARCRDLQKIRARYLATGRATNLPKSLSALG
jgi:hypothetical protein